MTQRKAPSLAPGAHLNNMFEIVKPIATDETGEVYEAHNIQTKDALAIRVVRPELARDETIVDQLRKEARILIHLHHDAIARYHVVSTDMELGMPFLAMELVEGPSLGDRIEAGPLDPASLASLQQHLAEGLEKVHQAGVLHRHLAPERIVLPGGRADRAKIIDFGVAGGAQLAGTYDFVSPEQLGLFGGEVTSRSDIYSLGLVLAACALGRALDMGGSETEAVEKRRSVPDLAGIDPPLRDLLETMLQPDPRHRPRSMAEVAAWPIFETSRPDATKTRLYTSPALRGAESATRPPSPSASAGPRREEARPKLRLVLTALAATAILLAAVYAVYW